MVLKTHIEIIMSPKNLFRMEMSPALNQNHQQWAGVDPDEAEPTYRTIDFRWWFLKYYSTVPMY
jgi:hypothetical protein